MRRLDFTSRYLRIGGGFLVTVAMAYTSRFGRKRSKKKKEKKNTHREIEQYCTSVRFEAIIKVTIMENDHSTITDRRDYRSRSLSLSIAIDIEKLTTEKANVFFKLNSGYRMRPNIHQTLRERRLRLPRQAMDTRVLHSRDIIDECFFPFTK